MRKTLYIIVMMVSAMALTVTSCSKWTEPDAVKLNIIYPWDRDPATWEDYFQRLRQYKERKHYITFAEFDNAPEKPAGEQDYLRCLPDSLDYISLTNAAAFRDADREDLSLMHRKGSKVLYTIDMAQASARYPEASQFSSFLQEAVSMVEKEGLDGWTVTADLPAGDEQMKARFDETVATLSAIEGKSLVYFGNFYHLSDQSLTDAFDLFVINTLDKEYEADIKFSIMMAKESSPNMKDKILIAGSIGTEITDSQLREREALDLMSELVFSEGPIAGLAIFNIKSDYYYTESNYKKTKGLIQKLNPSK